MASSRHSVESGYSTNRARTVCPMLEKEDWEPPEWERPNLLDRLRDGDWVLAGEGETMGEVLGDMPEKCCLEIRDRLRDTTDPKKACLALLSWEW